MDPIDYFLKSNKKFSLPLLLNTHARLKAVQFQQGFVTYDDAIKSLYTISNQASPGSDLAAHAGIIYEAAFVPFVTKKGQIAHRLQADTLEVESQIVDRVLKVLIQRSGGADSYCVDELKRDALNVFQNSFAFTARSAAEVHSVTDYRESDFTNRVQNETLPHSRAPEAVDLVDDYQSSALSRIECEKSEPVVRLLAQVRKIGMDILFPQITHDKILACIFAAIKSTATPAHRELIDMVMFVKESHKISHLQGVSKTKVRGVLALLKHGEMLITHGNEGNPVRLFLAKGINSFKDLRERHDTFLLKYMVDHHLFMPAILKSELVWQVDEETRSMRLDAMNKLTASLQVFFNDLSNLPGKPALGTDEGNSFDYLHPPAPPSAPVATHSNARYADQSAQGRNRNETHHSGLSQQHFEQDRYYYPRVGGPPQVAPPQLNAFGAPAHIGGPHRWEQPEWGASQYPHGGRVGGNGFAPGRNGSVIYSTEPEAFPMRNPSAPFGRAHPSGVNHMDQSDPLLYRLSGSAGNVRGGFGGTPPWMQSMASSSSSLDHNAPSWSGNYSTQSHQQVLSMDDGLDSLDGFRRPSRGNSGSSLCSPEETLRDLVLHSNNDFLGPSPSNFSAHGGSSRLIPVSAPSITARLNMPRHPMLGEDLLARADKLPVEPTGSVANSPDSALPVSQNAEMDALIGNGAAEDVSFGVQSGGDDN